MANETNQYLEEDKEKVRKTTTLRLSDNTQQELGKINASYSDAIAYLVGFYIERSSQTAETEEAIHKKIKELNERNEKNKKLLALPDDYKIFEEALKKKKEQLIRKLADIE